ncbi:MAG: hypothetical protein ABIY55_33390, partial [Kofleriaceae bacterium]
MFVAFAQTVIASDLDAVAPGVQTDVQLRTSLGAGEQVTLEVLDGAGISLATLAQPVDADGEVVFTGVSVPTPRVVLRATGRGTCGEGHDEITVDVRVGAGCALGLWPLPEASAFYAPLDVLSTRSDPDPLAPGYQTRLQVATRPGWTAELFETTDRERSLGVITADAGGVATLPVTVLDGRVGFRATCGDATTELASPTTTLVVDTTPPGCGLSAPVPGTTITPAFDANHDLGDGVQLAIAAHADGDDVVGEPVSLVISDPSGVPTTVAASVTDAAGTTTAAATLAPPSTPAQFYVALTMQDHAGNRCMATATYDVIYDACAIAVVGPTAPVTQDADGAGEDGGQLDVTLAVTPACAGQPVTTTCGASAPSAIVAPDGSAVLRIDACASSPCEAQVSCSFTVTATS